MLGKLGVQAEKKWNWISILNCVQKKKKKIHVDLRLKECKTITLLENIKIFKIRYKNVQTQKKRFVNLFA